MRNKPLDALRAIAVLLVLAYHGGAGIFARMGWAGVDLFFVISGFLISGLLFREFKTTATISVGRFLTRRGFKIYPGYYVFVIASVAYWQLVLHNPFPAGQILSNIFFAQNYMSGIADHLWSLAVEEHFYLVLPVVLWFAAKSGRSNPFSSLPTACGLIAVACLALRLVTENRHPSFDHLSQAAPSHLRIDSLCFGVVLAYLWEYHPTILDKLVRDGGWLVAGISTLLIAPCFVFPLHHPFMHTFGYSCLYLGFGGMLIIALKCVDSRFLVVKGLAKIGSYSYSIYLLHVYFLRLCAWGTLETTNGLTHGMGMVAYLVLSICSGILFAKFVEYPALKLREKLVPRPVELLEAACSR
jgi:peptidoglycan/LPS O-acetylase OafA/YrhL